MRRMVGRLHALWRDQRGAVTILAAVGLIAVMAAGALAVDLGAVYYESRRLQGVADAAALAAAGNPTTPVVSAQAAIDAARWARTVTKTVTTGTWTPDGSKAVAQRYVVGGSVTNAAKVKLAIDTPLYLGRALGLRSVHLVREATAARIDLASISIGSRLASLDGGLANALLGGLTGTTVSLNVADYDALLGADVDLLAYVAALKTELNVTAGSFDDVLKTATTTTQALRALKATLDATNNVVAGAVVAKIIAGAPGGSLVPSALISLGQIGGQDRVSTGTALNVNAYSTLTSLLQIAGGGRQVDLDLGVSIPGLTTTRATVVFGDRVQNSPWIAVTDKGSPIVSTAQTRIYLQVTALSSPLLQTLGIGGVRLPLYIELAAAQARLSSLTCSQTGRSAALDVQTSIGHVSIAELNTASLTPMSTTPTESAAKIVSVPLLNLNITGSARIDVSNNGWQTVNFNTSDIDNQTTKTVGSSGIVGGIAASLVGSLNLSLNGLPLLNGLLGGALRPVLTTVAPLLDGVLSGLLDLLGIHLGQADVRINGVRCGNAALVA